jgi:NADPH2:quinone reductase
MRAVVVKTPGGLDELALADMPAPEAGPGEVLVRVAFCGLNWADTMIRRGTYPHPFTYPVIPGVEVSGTVVAIGAGVARVKVGDRVAAFHEKGGGYAELFRTIEDWTIPIPDGLSLESAASFPVQALTAWHMLHTVGRVQAGHFVLVHAIGGGVGLWCTQLAVRAGAQVVGTVGTMGKEKKPLEFGASRVVLNGTEDFVPVALEMTGGRGVALAIDSLGARTLDRTFDAVRKLGHIISIGEAEGLPFQNIRERILPRSQTFTRFHLGHVDPVSAEWRAGLADVMGGLTDGTLRAPIEQIYPLEDARAMQEHIESRRLSGKLLLRVGA